MRLLRWPLPAWPRPVSRMLRILTFSLPLATMGTTAWMREVEQRRSSCRGCPSAAKYRDVRERPYLHPCGASFSHTAQAGFSDASHPHLLPVLRDVPASMRARRSDEDSRFTWRAHRSRHPCLSRCTSIHGRKKNPPSRRGRRLVLGNTRTTTLQYVIGIGTTVRHVGRRPLHVIDLGSRLRQ